MAKTSVANPHDPRTQATAAKLRAALHRLTTRSADRTVASNERLTVAALAREAGVGRNAIYANHRDVLADLIRARQQQSVPERTAAINDKITEQRGVIDDMQRQLRQLATENAGLLLRAIEAERRAERAEHRNAQLTREIDTLRRPTMLRTLAE